MGQLLDKAIFKLANNAPFRKEHVERKISAATDGKTE